MSTQELIKKCNDFFISENIACDIYMGIGPLMRRAVCGMIDGEAVVSIPCIMPILRGIARSKGNVPLDEAYIFIDEDDNLTMFDENGIREQCHKLIKMYNIP